MKNLFIFVCLFSLIQGSLAQEIGLQLYSLRDQFKEDVPGTLKLIQDWGITKIEGGGTYGLQMKEYEALLNKNALEMVSVGASFDDLENDPPKSYRQCQIFRCKICNVCLGSA